MRFLILGRPIGLKKKKKKLEKKSQEVSEQDSEEALVPQDDVKR